MSEQTAPAYLQRLSYQTGLLGLFTLLASSLLVLGHLATRDSIELRHQEDLAKSLSQVIPARLYDNAPAAQVVQFTGANGKPVQAYQARLGGTVTGVAFRVTGQGYAGAIQILMALDPEGRLLGVRVLSHSETPGLGDKIEADKADWIYRFDGLSLGNPPLEQWKVKKDGGRFDQFAGATITPRAVVKAIREGLEMFAHNQTGLLGRP